ncbi:MAG: hypothetical protein IPH26_13180 [Sterolibacteriaceae bacterium]|uniref:Uncharacterized protein n=1 Tax=Candidatus Methylophosphatis roskildensis TaxID=2899263 RepID=A0A9D7E4V9_9PROT|nr:hypothetical protein [Candidatus Methylophosphatis roskildensis]MBK7237896.1 hypothetical protein [Sterolibacteriaceae bacterium]
MSPLLTRLFPRFILRFAERLRFPQLFLLAGVLFVLDVLVPDVIPFVDEILLALATLILAAWRKRGDAPVAHGTDDRSPIPGEAARVD